MLFLPPIWGLQYGIYLHLTKNKTQNKHKKTKMRITFISDTHSKHNQIQLPGGDLLIHAGDIMTSGYSRYEVFDFIKWFDSQNYDTKIFIAGNHDRLFEDDKDCINSLMQEFTNIKYLQDRGIQIGEDWDENKFKVWGSPWQPEFYNWAFNLPRMGWELGQKWTDIPENTDILVTHGPPQGHLDTSGAPYNKPNLGCELLRVRVDEIKPKIHVFGHIHGGYGYKFHNGTHFINASVLNESYAVVNKPVTINWDPETNEITFI